ncbi:unnamed protein product, partial [Prorocentrum cordatum]
MLTRASVVHEADTQRTQSVEKNQCSTLHAEKHPTHLHSRRTPAHVHPAGAVAGAVKRAPRKASPELGVRFHARGCSSRLRACIGFGKKAVEKVWGGGEGSLGDGRRATGAPAKMAPSVGGHKGTSGPEEQPGRHPSSS